MTAKIISVANMKGGVGKTTIAVALTHEFAKGVGGDKGARVLLIDLDAQANASFWLCGDAILTELIEKGRTIDGFLEDTIVFGQTPSLKDYVREVELAGEGVQVHVIPSSPNLRIVEREMISFLSRRTRSLLEVERVVSQLLIDQLEQLKSDFDVIVFDSAPGISALTEAALRSSDIVVVPTVPDFISNLGLEAFCKTALWANRDAEPGQKSPWVVANKVRVSAHHTSLLQQMRAESKADEGSFKMFDIEIPDIPWIEEANARVNGGSGRSFASDASGLFSKLAKEVSEVTHGPRH